MPRPISMDIIGSLLLLAAGLSFAAEPVNTGQDFTRPVTRTDLRVKYQELIGNASAWTYTVRADKPVSLSNGWELAMRADLPFMSTNLSTPDHPEGNVGSGMSDALLQGLLVSAPGGVQSGYAVGVQALFPTASDERMGSGKYQLLPTAGLRRDMSGWMEGSWWAVLVRQAFDVASRDDARPGISQTYLNPALNLDLPGLWFVTFAPEARYDWREEKWHVPFDITAGRLVDRKTVFSLEYKSAVVDDLPLFEQEVEARVGIFF
jgi:hypothetical protein